MRLEFLLLLITAAPAPAPPPPRLERPSHDVLLVSDFRDGRMDGWRPDRPGTWSVRDGALCGILPDGKQRRSVIYAGSPEWTDYAVDLDVCGVRGVDKGMAVRAGDRKGVGVDLRGAGYGDVLLHTDSAELGRAPAPNANGRWHHLRVEALGDRYRVFVDGALRIDHRDSSGEHPSGGVALAAYTGGSGHCDVRYANVIVTSLRSGSSGGGRTASRRRAGRP